MTDIFFCATRHFYDSYQDFFTLASLSDFPIIFTDEIDISREGVYIISPWNGDVEQHLKNEITSGKRRNAHLVLWNIERPSGTAGIMAEYNRRQHWLLSHWYADEIWVSDAALAIASGLRFVVLGSDEGLGEPSDEKQYDFCHMSYEIPRRKTIYDHFTNVGPNAWPPERDAILKQSRFFLNVHQDIHSFQEPLRWALAAAYGLPIISEDCFDITPWSSETIITTGWDNLVGRLRQALSDNYGPYRDMGLRARERMTGEFRFKKCVEQAISETVNRWR